jgi:hypothetical protein
MAQFVLIFHKLLFMMAGEKYRLLNFGVLVKISLMTHEKKAGAIFSCNSALFGYM